MISTTLSSGFPHHAKATLPFEGSALVSHPYVTVSRATTDRAFASQGVVL